MLFGYPVAATRNNWFHDCLCETLRTIHALADANEGYPDWPSVLPTAHRKPLEDRPKLRGLLKAYNDAIRQLAREQRDMVLGALESENRIPELLSGAQDCVRADGLPQVVQEPVAELFEFAFQLLAPLKVRDQHYAAVHAEMPAHVCPFCGIEHFSSPRSKREALDHYLARSYYPFAAANLRNLVPMCHKCNSGYKLAADMVRRVDGTGRVAFDPYNHTRIQVLLDESDPFGGSTEILPNWRIRFLPETPEVSTWDDVFSVRERYRQDHLDDAYVPWIRQFAELARDRVRPYSDEKLIEALRWYEEAHRDPELEFHERAFLKAAVFRMLRQRCQQKHSRLLKLLRDLVAPPDAEPVAVVSEPAVEGARTSVAVGPVQSTTLPEVGSVPPP